jgi:transcriptional regulator with GAF, ATPase, and Fis domain
MNKDEPMAAHTAVAVAETFVQLADTLVDDYDVVDLLDRLATAAVRLLGHTAAGILLDDQHGHLAVVASSSEETRLLEVFQLQSAQGPCLDAVRSATIVTCGDLAAESRRWPLFCAAAVDAGFRSVVAVPLRLRHATIGALNMFDAAPRTSSQPEQRLAQSLADIATIGILQQRSLHRTSVLAEQLQQALNSRVVIEQAKGVLAERNQVSMSLAFQALRKHARDTNRKLAAAAQAVVAGDIEIDHREERNL